MCISFHVATKSSIIGYNSIAVKLAHCCNIGSVHLYISPEILQEKRSFCIRRMIEVDTQSLAGSNATIVLHTSKIYTVDRYPATIGITPYAGTVAVTVAA